MEGATAAGRGVGKTLKKIEHKPENIRSTKMYRLSAILLSTFGLASETVAMMSKTTDNIKRGRCASFALRQYNDELF